MIGLADASSTEEDTITGGSPKGSVASLGDDDVDRAASQRSTPELSDADSVLGEPAFDPPEATQTCLRCKKDYPMRCFVSKAAAAKGAVSRTIRTCITCQATIAAKKNVGPRESAKRSAPPKSSRAADEDANRREIVDGRASKRRKAAAKASLDQARAPVHARLARKFA